MAQVEQTEGRAKQAIVAYEKLAELDPDNEAVLLELVFLLLENDRAEDAVEAYKRLRAPPTFPAHLSGPPPGSVVVQVKPAIVIM